MFESSGGGRLGIGLAHLAGMRGGVVAGHDAVHRCDGGLELLHARLVNALEGLESGEGDQQQQTTDGDSQQGGHLALEGQGTKHGILLVREGT